MCTTRSVCRAVFRAIGQQTFRTAPTKNFDDSTHAEPTHAPGYGLQNGLRGSHVIVENLPARLRHRRGTAIAKAAGAQGPLILITEVLKNCELPAGRDRDVSQHFLK